jgi:hypothetical protein
MPRNRLTDATLVFSGSSLIVFRFHPVLADWTVQTLTRYGLPVGIFRRQRPGRSTQERSRAPDVSELGPRLSARTGGGGLAPITVPAASALPVRAPAAD